MRVCIEMMLEGNERSWSTSIVASGKVQATEAADDLERVQECAGYAGRSTRWKQEVHVKM